MIIMLSCNNNQQDAAVKSGERNPDTANLKMKPGSFGYDVDFLKQYQKDLLVLSDSAHRSQIIVSPAFQGRVMTSTAEGDSGMSFGWLNHALISSGQITEHINAFGGEDRFWLGPEGGQFALYFKKGNAFTFENWYVPKELDTEPFNLISSSATEAKLEKEMHLENYSGNVFDIKVQRKIKLLDSSTIASTIAMAIPVSITSVGFESENVITNNGKGKWNDKTGLVSIWILSMLNASPQTTIAIPFKQGDSSRLGKIVTDNYFGKVPADRLNVKQNIMLFKADGNHRSKIGISPSRALPRAASYDALNQVLTIVEFNLPDGKKNYVNSLWEIQKQPFAGDAVNAYNDGPIDGKQMGKFYELESSSPAESLAPGQSLQHIHRTIHFKGDKTSLDKIALSYLGVTTDQIKL